MSKISGLSRQVFLPKLAPKEYVNRVNKGLEKCGFGDVRIVDESVTSVGEQRTTQWMTHNSLPDYLDPNDPSKTLEGYPAPRRAILVAKKL